MTTDGTPGLPTSLGTHRPGTVGTILTIPPSTGDMIPGTMADGTIHGSIVLIMAHGTVDGTIPGSIVPTITMAGTADGMTLGSTILGTMAAGTVDGTVDGMIPGTMAATAGTITDGDM